MDYLLIQSNRDSSLSAARASRMISGNLRHDLIRSVCTIAVTTQQMDSSVMPREGNFMQAHVQPGDLDTLSPTTCIRASLRLWGYDPLVVEAWIKRLPDARGRVSWEIAHDREANGADVVVHLLNPSRTSAPFCWNCAGASRAMRLSIGTGRTEIALFAGRFQQLEFPRVGPWFASEGLPIRMALHKLAQSLVTSFFD